MEKYYPLGLTKRGKCWEIYGELTEEEWTKAKTWVNRSMSMIIEREWFNFMTGHWEVEIKAQTDDVTAAKNASEFFKAFWGISASCPCENRLY